MKKYEFISSDTIKHLGITLTRIRRLSDGAVGGYLEAEANLSHEGACWVSGSALVSGSARVYGSAGVSDSAWVYGSARVSDSAQVYGSARVSGSAWVSGSALVYGSAHVFDEAQVYGSARVSGSALAFGSAHVSGSARVSGSALVYGSAHVFDEAQVYGSAHVFDEAQVYDSAHVCGSAHVSDLTTSTPLVLAGLKWTVTITDASIRIGCQVHTPAEWAGFSPAAVRAMDATAPAFYAAYMPLILKLAESHCNRTSS